MTPENWKRIKAIKVPPIKMLHVSEGDWNKTTRRFTKGSGSTYYIGRNAAKRAAKET